jgi:multicomponent Na+:H+ antiporter subunit E
VQPLAVLWLTLVWLAMWGEVTPLLVIGGVLVAVLVCLAFPLPPIDLASGVRPLALARLVGRFLVDVVRASFQVSGVVLRRRPVRNAVVAVDLESSSDFVMTLVASMLSLIPGSVVVEARRSTHSLFIHALGVDDDEAVERERERVLRTEEQLIRAFGQTITPREPS